MHFTKYKNSPIINTIKEEPIMENQKRETVIKTLRLEKELTEKIQKMAAQSQRDFTKQVRFMLLEYIKMKETN